MTDREEYTCSHFSICNPAGRTQGNLPKLLRRLATEIAALGENTMVLDVTLVDEVDENGPWWQATVYYSRDGWKDGADNRDSGDTRG